MSPNIGTLDRTLSVIHVHDATQKTPGPPGRGDDELRLSFNS
jgi:hypothetical protein